MTDIIQVARSFVEAGALADVLNQAYDFDRPVTCKLFSKMLRTQDNDHYLVMDGRQRYVARVYQQGDHLGRQKSDYQYELDWLNFLKEQGMPVSYPIPRADGRYLGSVHAPEGKRYVALFSYADGQPITLPVRDEERLYTMGEMLARIHTVSNDFETSAERRPMDLNFLVDESVAHIKRFWGNDPDRSTDMDILLMSAEEAREEIEDLIANEEQTEDSWGPIVGDFHTANTHVDRNGNMTFFNFDLCGPGWRAYDIASFLLNTNLIHQKTTDLSEAFFAGYYSVRPLSNNEHQAIAPFLTIRRIWLTGNFTRADGMSGHTFIGPV